MSPLAAIERIRTNVSGLIFEILRRSGIAQTARRRQKKSSEELAAFARYESRCLAWIRIPSLVLLLEAPRKIGEEINSMY